MTLTERGDVILSAKIDRTGEKNIATNGQIMTIIAYRNRKDIDVQFEDGTIIAHKGYADFQKGEIKNPNKSSQFKSKIGETGIAKNGLKMKIINYRGCMDIDIQFEDNTIIKHKTYNNFKKGNISNPKIISNHIITQKQAKSRIGETNIADNGMKMTIIAYRNAKDIDIQFEDKTIAVNKAYGNFMKGHIKHPNISKSQKIIKQIEERTGEKNIAKNGLQMTIIKYRSSGDIDVQFEDGAIAFHKTYGSFKKGDIKNPNLFHQQRRTEKQMNERIGETNIANNGMEMKIIAYRRANDIDIQFENGTIVTNKKYREFKIGSVKCPTEPRIGETNIAMNKLKMTIIAYRGCADMDIQFEDGAIVTNKTYQCFQRGAVGHPFPYQMNNMLIEKPAYIHNNIGSFYCACTKCGHTDIMTIDEMKQHKCIEPTKGDTYAEDITGTEC